MQLASTHPQCSVAADPNEDPVKELGLLLKRIVQANAGVRPGLAMPLSHECADDWTTHRVKAEAAFRYGNFSACESAWLKALEAAQNFKTDDTRLVYTLECIAHFYVGEQNYAKGEYYALKALTIIEDVHGVADLRVAACLNHLAELYYSLRRYAEAEQLAVRMLKIYNKVHGAEHDDVGMVASNLAMIYHVQNKLDLAEMMYERAIPIRKRTLGTHHSSYKTLIENFANLLEATGRTEKAAAARNGFIFDGWHIFSCTLPVVNPVPLKQS